MEKNNGVKFNRHSEKFQINFLLISLVLNRYLPLEAVYNFLENIIISYI